MCAICGVATHVPDTSRAASPAPDRPRFAALRNPSYRFLVRLSMHGLAGAIWAPAEQLMLHDLNGRETLPNAVRLNSTGRSVGFLAGRVLGSLMLLVLGPAVAIFANVLLYLPMTIWLARTPFTDHVRDRLASRSSRVVAPVDAMRVRREVVTQPVPITMVTLGGLSSFLIGSGIQPQMPEFAVDLGLNQAGVGYGMLLAVNSAGAVLGGMVLETTHRLVASQRAALVSTLAWSACLLGFAIFATVQTRAGVVALGTLTLAVLMWYVLRLSAAARFSVAQQQRFA
jgi:hypothetical protein